MYERLSSAVLKFQTSPHPIALTFLICSRTSTCFPLSSSSKLSCALMPSWRWTYNQAVNVSETQSEWTTWRYTCFGACILAGVSLSLSLLPSFGSFFAISIIVCLIIFCLFCPCVFRTIMVINCLSFYSTSWMVHVVNPFETIVQVNLILSCSACKRRRGN